MTVATPPISSSTQACPLCDRHRAARERRDDFDRCAGCDAWFRRRRDPDHEVGRWNENIDDERERRYDAMRGPYYRHYWRLLRRLPRSSTRRILDVGCMPGYLLREAARDGWETHGVEITDDLCALTRETVPARMWSGRVEAIDFGAERFDLITLNDVIRVMRDPRGAVVACAKLLEPGGALVIREIDADHARVARRLARPDACDMQMLGHRALSILLRGAGLDRVRVCNSPMSLLTIPRIYRMARGAPRVYGHVLTAVNAGVGLVGPPGFTPSCLAIGHRSGPC